MLGSKTCLTLALALLATALVGVEAAGDIPATMNYQVMLTDDSDEPLADQQVDLVFRIYNEASVLQWSESHNDVWTNSIGVVSVVLGETTPLEIEDFTVPLWLEIEVNTEILTPRRELTSAPYALRAGDSDQLGGADASAYSLDGHNHDAAYVNEGQGNSVTDGMIVPDVVSSLDGVTNDGGDIDLVGGSNVTITPDDASNTITISASGGSGDITGVYGDQGLTGSATSGDAHLSVGAGDGIDVSSDAVMVDVDDFAGDGLGDDGLNNLKVNTGSGLQVTGDAVGLTSSYSSGSAYDGRFVNEFQAGSISTGMIVPNVVSSVDGVVNDGGNIDLVQGANITITPNDAANTITIASTGGDDGDWSTSGADIYRLTGNVGIGTSSPDERLHVQGTAQFGSSVADGRIELYRSGSASPIVEIMEHPPYGGSMAIYDEAHNRLAGIWPDFSVGGGGELDVFRNEMSQGFTVNGNFDDTEQPVVGITGSSYSVYFNMDLSGTDLVWFPTNAISDYEIIDEPGCASVGAAASTGIELTGGIDELASQTIDCPTSGYVLALASAQAWVDPHTADYLWVRFGVSEVSTAFVETGDLDWMLPAGATQNDWRIPLTAQTIFPVTSGLRTFYFLGEQANGGTVRVNDIHLNLIFIPTAYGTIYDPVLETPAARDQEGGSRPPLTTAEIEAQRAESEAFNAARIEGELAQMRAEMEEMRRRLDEEGR